MAVRYFVVYATVDDAGHWTLHNTILPRVHPIQAFEDVMDLEQSISGSLAEGRRIVLLNFVLLGTETTRDVQH